MTKSVITCRSPLICTNFRDQSCPWSYVFIKQYPEVDPEVTRTRAEVCDFWVHRALMAAKWNLYYLRLNCSTFQESSWWRHQMEKFSALLALCEGNPPVTDGFPSQRSVTRSFDVEQTIETPWFETPSRSLWRHCNDSHGLPFVVFWSDLLLVGYTHILRGYFTRTSEVTVKDMGK